MKDYRTGTIKAIRAIGDAFDGWTDEDVAYMYSNWLEKASDWIDDEVKAFYKYATTRPMDLFARSN